MRYYVKINEQEGAEVNTLKHAALLACDEFDAPPHVYDNLQRRWLTGAEILLAAITNEPKNRVRY